MAATVPVLKTILNLSGTERQIDLKLVGKYWGTCTSKTSLNCSNWKSKMVTIVAMLQIYFELFLLKQKAKQPKT